MHFLYGQISLLKVKHRRIPLRFGKSAAGTLFGLSESMELKISVQLGSCQNHFFSDMYMQPKKTCSFTFPQNA